MLPVNSGSHSAYQNFVTINLRKYYPDPDSLPRSTWGIIEHFWHLDLFYTDELLNPSVEKRLVDTSSLSIAGDGTPVVTSAKERKHRVCDCAEKGVMDCDCDHYFSQPDCDIGWDSS